ncbi:MAG: histidine kinase [Betaproteobacteria bacterium]
MLFASFPVHPGLRQARQLGLRFLEPIREHATAQRVLAALAVCLIVSTQAFFQPQLYTEFSLAYLIRQWLDYLGECLLMATPITLVLLVADAASRAARRWVRTLLALLAIVAGATAGRLLLIAYYDFPWTDIFERDFSSDIIYWTAIAAGVITIHTVQKGLADASHALHRSEVDQLQLSKQMLEARLQVLRAQIEPHFLFNALANAKRLCQTDVGRGLTMLEHLLRYLRAALPKMRGESSTLGEEVDLVTSYLAVLQIRMGNRLRHRVEVASRLQSHPFPPMMLLTLVENSIKHGIAPASNGGAISVLATAAGEFLEVTVADTGVGFGAAPTAGTGVGLSNTRDRLAALHGSAGELRLASNEPHGVLATIRLPLHDAGAAQD